ncbi:PQ-loop repeat-containing protein [Aspergillus nidulans FGSC A4]|uniref:Uncharacterized protein n=1 Tax=Emericella nidulans (strain FGSC A4 / ATCC 38163 / CBS 112.46 / NRRL 194 / M139) TaxID=227321 RepID=C8V783_EMENI|nr:hypothetical protein [Aspergillus nidulans FGSC A4]CBF74131.1 TPA: conserved hypothetical protein [Aspergillus nidulans FGSC A4]
MYIVSQLLEYGAPIFIVTSPVTSYADQILSIHRNRSSAGFSLDIPLIMLVASILKVFFWVRRLLLSRSPGAGHLDDWSPSHTAKSCPGQSTGARAKKRNRAYSILVVPGLFHRCPFLHPHLPDAHLELPHLHQLPGILGTGC